MTRWDFLICCVLIAMGSTSYAKGSLSSALCCFSLVVLIVADGFMVAIKRK